MKQLLTILLVTIILASCKDNGLKTFDVKSFNGQSFFNLTTENLDSLPLFFVTGMGDDHNQAIANSIKDAGDELKKYNTDHGTLYKIIDVDLQNLAYDSQVLKYVAVIKVKVSK